MTGSRGASLARRARSAGGRAIRRLRLLPEGTPDGLGQDKELLGRTLPHSVMVFFPDPPSSLRRVEQWYPQLAELDRQHRVVVVTMDSRSCRAVRRVSRLDTLAVARYTTMDDLLSRSAVKLALYVADHPDNFSNLRFNTLVHARLVAATGAVADLDNRVKAYDFCLIPRQRGAIDDVPDTGHRTTEGEDPPTVAIPFYDVAPRWLSVRSDRLGHPVPEALVAPVRRLIDIRDREAARLRERRVSSR